MVRCSGSFHRLLFLSRDRQILRRHFRLHPTRVQRRDRVASSMDTSKLTSLFFVVAYTDKLFLEKLAPPHKFTANCAGNHDYYRPGDDPHHQRPLSKVQLPLRHNGGLPPQLLGDPLLRVRPINPSPLPHLRSSGRGRNRNVHHTGRHPDS